MTASLGIRVIRSSPADWRSMKKECRHARHTYIPRVLWLGRKYLDALCVYLWATTPVLISVLTFVTFVLLGNTLTAAKARSLFIPAVVVADP